MSRLPNPATVLVVEDMALVADEIVAIVESLGCEVAGPFGCLDAAMKFVSELDLPNRPRLDLALLDVNLHGRQVYPLAETLLVRGVPVVFLTGYTVDSIPASFRDNPCLEKPFDRGELEQVIGQAMAGTVIRVQPPLR